MRLGNSVLWVLALFVVIVSKIPTFAALHFTPAGYQWTGILSRNTADFNSYLSIVEETRRQGLLAHNLFTAEPHPAFQIRPLHNVLGLIGRLAGGISSLTLLNIVGLLTCFVLAGSLILIVKIIFPTTRERVIAFLVLVLAGGLGWTQAVPDPPDLRIVETSTFLTFLSPPLYQTSLALLVGIILLLTHSWNVNDRKRTMFYSGIAGLLAIWLGLERPFSLAPLTVSILVSALFLSAFHLRRLQSSLFTLFPVLIAVGLVLLFQFSLMRRIPVYGEWNRQHILPTPGPLRIIFALGLLIPLAIPGVREIFRKSPVFASLVCFYIPSSLLFAYSPLRYQERFLEGLPLSMAIVASVGMMKLLNRLQNSSARTLVTACLIAILLPSSLIGLSRDLEAVARQSPPQFLPVKLIEGMRKLSLISEPQEAVLSSQAVGNFIPAYAVRPVVIGHNIATARANEKKALVFHIFQMNANDPQVAQLIRFSGAKWLFWSPEEALLTRNRFHPEYASYLQREYSNGLVTLYRINLETGTR